MKVRLLFVAQWILVPNVFVAQWILVKSDQIEIFRSLYFSLKSWLCCCSLASLVPQQLGSRHENHEINERYYSYVLSFTVGYSSCTVTLDWNLANIEIRPLPKSAVMGAAMSMEEEKPAMFCFCKKETVNAPQAHRVYLRYLAYWRCFPCLRCFTSLRYFACLRCLAYLRCFAFLRCFGY